MSQALKIIDKKRKLKQKSQWSRNKFKKFFWRLICLVFVGLVGYILFFSSFLNITHIEIKGNKNVASNKIKKQVENQLVGKYFNWIKKNNLFLVKSKKLAKNILTQFKIIRKVEIKKKFPSKLVIFIQERTPSLIITSARENYLLDENGQAYMKASLADQKIKNDLIILVDKSNRKISLGEIVLDKNYLIYLKNLKKKLTEETNLKVVNNFQTLNLFSDNIRVKTQEGWEIYFNKKINLDKSIEALRVILTKEINSQQRLDLEYVDLRIKNKVYYRFRDGTPEAMAIQQENATSEIIKNGDKQIIKKKK